MKVENIRGTKWAIEFDWEYLKGTSSIKAETKAASLKNKCPYAVLINQGLSGNQTARTGAKSVAVGFCKTPVKQNSAAYSLALANDAEKNSSSDFDHKQDWIVIEDLGNDKFWYVVIAKGVPLPNTDKIVPRTALIEEINDFLINDVYKVFSTSEDIREIYENDKEIINKGLNELTAGITEKTKYIKVTGIPPQVVAGLGVVLTLGLVYVGVTQYLDSSMAQKQRAEALRMAQDEEDRKRQLYEEKLKQYEAEYALVRDGKINEVLNNLAGEPNKILNAIYEAVGSVELDTNGWVTNSIDCAFTPMGEKKLSCVRTLKRTGLTTNRILLQDFPDAVIVGDEAKVSRGIVVMDDISKVPPKSFLDKLPTAKTWGFDMVSQLQLLKIVGVEHKISNSSEIFFDPPIKPISEQEIAAGQVQQTPLPVSINISKGTIDLESDSFVILGEIANNIDFSSVGVRKVDFKLDPNNRSMIRWKINMEYFVKNGDGVIGSADSSSLKASHVEDAAGVGAGGAGGNNINGGQPNANMYDPSNGY